MAANYVPLNYTPVKIEKKSVYYPEPSDLGFDRFCENYFIKLAVLGEIDTLRDYIFFSDINGAQRTFAVSSLRFFSPIIDAARSAYRVEFSDELFDKELDYNIYPDELESASIILRILSDLNFEYYAEVLPETMKWFRTPDIKEALLNLLNRNDLDGYMIEDINDILDEYFKDIDVKN